ncbi:MAG: histidine kinase [Bacteroidetes bacterium]|nr:histidine kinase [Bacteroidota bacterium]
MSNISLKNDQKWAPGGFAILTLGLAIFWGKQLHESLTLQYAGEWDQLGGFLRWLMGYVFILLGLTLISWLNFKGPYQWWGIRSKAIWTYRSWALLLFFFLYLFLHWTTGSQVDLVEENLLVAMLAFAFVMGFTFVGGLIRSKNLHAKRLQQQTATELQALRSQLNPHFLFNALNTLYSHAVPLKDESLAERIQELSGILRFTLQQAQKEFVSIEEELTFLHRYIGLQQARIAEPERVHIDIQWDQSEASIPPLLLLPFVENLFKYGISPQKDTQAKLTLYIEDGKLNFSTVNPIGSAQQKGTGNGIEQVKRRLALRYPDHHQLSIQQKDGQFIVQLRLELNHPFVHSTHNDYDLTSHSY